MIRFLACCLFGCMLSGCQTPLAVRDMSTLTAKFAAQMDNGVTTYVADLNTNNNSDTTRIQDELADAARQGAANTDDMAGWRLVSGTRAANVNRLFGAVSSLSANDSNPITGGGPLTSSTAAHAPTKITFDDAPLKTIGNVAGSIAKPKTQSDQLSVISAYAKAVQGDLKKAASTPAGGK